MNNIYQTKLLKEMMSTRVDLGKISETYNRYKIIQIGTQKSIVLQWQINKKTKEFVRTLQMIDNNFLMQLDELGCVL